MQFKIYADFLNADTKGRVRLNTNGTFQDLERANITLIEGLEIILDDYNGVVTKGIVHFSEDENLWVAIVDWDSF